MDEDEPIGYDDYEMVLPFPCTTSSGGPYDDDSFVAGVRYGMIYAALIDGFDWSGFIEPALEFAVDLLAMRFGALMTIVDDRAAAPWIWAELTIVSTGITDEDEITTPEAS